MRKSILILGAIGLASWSPLCANSEPVPDVTALTTSAEKGDALAQFQLGRAYYRGAGLPKDEKKAVEWMEKAAAQGNTDAITSMGFFHAQGIGVEESETKAVEWFRRGAENGSATCKLNLGLLLRQGKTIQTSSDESLRLMHEAAEAGSVEAQSYLGQLYFMGDRFLKPDPAKAKPHALKAAEAGVAASKEKDGAILDTLARVVFLKGDAPRAIELQKKAIEAAPAGQMKDSMKETLKEYEASLKKA